MIFETKLCPGLLQPTLSSKKACCVLLPSEFKFCFHYMQFLSYSSCSTQCMKIQQLSILESCQPTTQTRSPPKKRFAKFFPFSFTRFLSFETFTVNLYEFALDRKLAHSLPSNIKHHIITENTIWCRWTPGVKDRGNLDSFLSFYLLKSPFVNLWTH